MALLSATAAGAGLTVAGLPPAVVPEPVSAELSRRSLPAGLKSDVLLSGVPAVECWLSGCACVEASLWMPAPLPLAAGAGGASPA